MDISDSANGLRISSVILPSSTTKRTILDYWRGFDPSVNHRKSRKSSDRSGARIGPMARLWRAMRYRESVQVMTRGLREPRAILAGRLIAFDRYWNLILSDTTVCTVNLRKSDLTGYGRPNRSQRRRLQRQARSLRQCKALSKGDATAMDPVELASYPLEIGQLLSINDVPDDALIWGCDSSFPDHSVSKSGRPAVVEEPIVIQPLDAHASVPECVSVSTQTSTQSKEKKGSQWSPSITQLTFARVDNLRPKNSRTSSNFTVNASNFKSSSTEPAQLASTSQPSQRGQLFIRGANVVSVIFPTHTKSSSMNKPI